MSLQDIQQAFAAAVYGEQPEALARITAGPCQATSFEGIAVYRNNTRERLRSVLAQTFPVCAQLVGERCFDHLAWVHIDQHPCRTHDLELYGELFSQTVADVLSAQEQLRESVPYLVEMAQVEWTAHRAYFASRRTSFDFQKFASLTEEQYLKASFQLAPGMALMAAGWPVAALWAMHQPGSSIEPFPVEPGEHWLLIERPLYKVQVLEIVGQLYETLSLINRGYSLLELLEHSGDAIQGDLAEALKRGWVVGFRA